MENQPPQVPVVPEQPAQSINPQPPVAMPQAPQSQVAQKRGMFRRRIGRVGFLLGFIYVTLANILMAGLLFGIFFPLNGHGAGSGTIVRAVLNIFTLLLMVIIVVVNLIITVSLYVRRLHDMGHSDVFFLLLIVLALIPFVNIAAGLYMLFMPGKKEANSYGPPITSHNFWVVLGFKYP